MARIRITPIFLIVRPIDLKIETMMTCAPPNIHSVFSVRSARRPRRIFKTRKSLKSAGFEELTSDLPKSRVVARRQRDLDERNEQNEEIDEIRKGEEVFKQLDVEFEREFHQIN